MDRTHRDAEPAGHLTDAQLSRLSGIGMPLIDVAPRAHPDIPFAEPLPGTSEWLQRLELARSAEDGHAERGVGRDDPTPVASPLATAVAGREFRSGGWALNGDPARLGAEHLKWSTSQE